MCYYANPVSVASNQFALMRKPEVNGQAVVDGAPTPEVSIPNEAAVNARGVQDTEKIWRIP
jgi:hypothetical protein